MSAYTINTAPDNTGIAPKAYTWSAWFGDSEDDCTKIGHGPTEAEAVDDLISNYDCPWWAT